MNFLLPNVTSPRNIGDLAIFSGLLSVIGKKNKFVLHSTEHNLNKNILRHVVSPTLYSWAVFERKVTASRVLRMTDLFINYFSLRILKISIPLNGKLQNLINDYKNSDVILFAGGGYIRSQKGITQSLNLIMTLMMFQFAKLMPAKKFVAPISFGPFAYRWQEECSASVLQDMDLVAAREVYSYNLLKKHKIKNLIQSSDTSLFLKFPKIDKNKNFTLGFTIRKWLNIESQEKFENEFVSAIVKFSKYTDITIQPIVQVDAPEYGDDDAKLTEKISEILKQNNLKVNKTVKVVDLKDSVRIYGKINLLLGMRMHSNILAALHATPFVAIAYEHKTKGISSDLGVEEYCIDVADVNQENLSELLYKAYKNRVYLTNTINKSVNRIRKEESDRWTKIFQN